MLLVLAILAIMLGGGLGVFAALDLGRRQAVGLVKSMVRSAQNTAVSQQSPTQVRIDPEAGTMWAESQRVVGTWHFEDRQLLGAFGLEGGMRDAEFVTDGYLGDALCFSGVGSFAEIQVKHDPAWDFRDGFAIEVVVRKDEGGGGRFLRVGKTIGIEIGGLGDVRGWFTSRIDDNGRPQAGGKVIVQSDPGMLPPGRWTRLRLEYDRARFTLFVDGTAVKYIEETAPVWKVEDSLVLSDPDRPFPGCIDSLVVSAVVSSEVAALPDTVRFLADTIRIIRFDSGGALDRKYHSDPVFLTVEFDDGTMESVAVGVYGTVE